MADIAPEVLDVAKVGGGGALVMLLGKVLAWWRGDQEQVLRELRALREGVAALTTKVEVMGANVENHIARVARLESELEAVRAESARNGQDLAVLRAGFESMRQMMQSLSEGR